MRNLNRQKGRYSIKPLTHDTFDKKKIDGLVTSLKVVTPVKTGVQKQSKRLDSRFRGNDIKEQILTFYEAVINLLYLLTNAPATNKRNTSYTSTET